MSAEAPARHYERACGARIAYHMSCGESPTVVFLGGYASDMTGTKAMFLSQWCRRRGQAYLRFDYQGHGASSGTFRDGTIGNWADDARELIGAVSEGPLVLVGSSMGGWIMVLTALAMRDRVRALIGVAAAPDFTEDLMWAGFSTERREHLERDGEIHLCSDYSQEPYVVTRALIEDGRRHLVLRSPIALGCPVRLVHGLADADVPWQTSKRLLDQLDSSDVGLTLVKNGDHRLSQPHELDFLGGALEAALAQVSPRL